MKIYAYYHDIGFSGQDELVDLWKQNWQQHGFDPVVLSLSDAKAHPFYREFVSAITGRYRDALSMYGLHTFIAWLAFANQRVEQCYVSDIDVFNRSLTPDDPIMPDRLHFLNRKCTCFASGRPSHYLRLCRQMARNGGSQLPSAERQWHDQTWVVENFDRIKRFPWTRFSKGREVCDGKVLHFSHNVTQQVKTERGLSTPKDALRIQLIKECSEIW